MPLVGEDQIVARWVERAAAVWPQISRDAPACAAELKARLDAAEVSAIVEGEHAADLFLAWAAARGDGAAVAAIDRILASELAGWLRRLQPSEAELAEVGQTLRCRLLVATAVAPPRIAEYRGRGPLAAWLRVTALHAALDLRRRAARTPPAAGDPALAVAVSPELAYVKERCGRDLGEALAAALATLSARERNLLRLHYLDGLSTSEIGVVLRLHRTTVRRQLDDAHARLRAGVRAVLAEQLGVDATEIESLIRVADSQLVISLAGCLRE